MDYDVYEVDPGAEFKVCPECGYRDGFHSMFRTEGERRQWLFICPQCHTVFDIGLTV